jgi:hypothetical protein
MTKLARGRSRGNIGRGRDRSRGRSRQAGVQVEDKRLLPLQIVNRTQGTRWKQSTSHAKRQTLCRFTYNKHGH